MANINRSSEQDEGERRVRALQVLRAWSHTTAPSRAAHSLSALFGGLPAIAYAPPVPGYGASGRVATANFQGDLFRTPFITREVIFDPLLTSLSENPVWGVTEHPVMGQDLARDARRWRLFRETLLDPLRAADNLSVRIVDGNHWIGWFGVLKSVWFTEREASLYTWLLDPLRDVVHACCALSPASGAVHPDLQMMHAWPEPAFAVTDTGYVLFVNRTGRRQLEREPEWLSDTLASGTEPPRTWHTSQVKFSRGTIMIYFRALTSPGRRFIDAAAAAELQLPVYLDRLVGCVLRGSSVPELVKDLGKSAATIATYVARIRGVAEVKSRAQLTYRVFERVFSEPDLWPTAISMPSRSCEGGS